MSKKACVCHQMTGDSPNCPAHGTKSNLTCRECYDEGSSIFGACRHCFKGRRTAQEWAKRGFDIRGNEVGR